MYIYIYSCVDISCSILYHMYIFQMYVNNTSYMLKLNISLYLFVYHTHGYKTYDLPE